MSSISIRSVRILDAMLMILSVKQRYPSGRTRGRKDFTFATLQQFEYE
jgi:hypothetical protein